MSNFKRRIFKDKIFIVQKPFFIKPALLSAIGFLIMGSFYSCTDDIAYPDPPVSSNLVLLKQEYIQGNDTLRYLILPPEHIEPGKNIRSYFFVMVHFKEEVTMKRRFRIFRNFCLVISEELFTRVTFLLRRFRQINCGSMSVMARHRK